MSDDWARPVVHWEIEARDPEGQRAFYGSLFNWEIGDGPIMQIPAGLGGPEPGPGGHLRQGDRSGVTPARLEPWVACSRGEPASFVVPSD